MKKTYRSWLAELKSSIQQCRLQTSLQVNSNMLMLYWYMGRQIDEKMNAAGWGKKIIPRISSDLQKSFPDLKGFSERNLLYMQQFSVSSPELMILQKAAANPGHAGKRQFTQQPVAQIQNKNTQANKAILQQVAAKSDNKNKNTKNTIMQQAVAQLEQYTLNKEQQEVRKFLNRRGNKK